MKEKISIEEDLTRQKKAPNEAVDKVGKKPWLPTHFVFLVLLIFFALFPLYCSQFITFIIR